MARGDLAKVQIDRGLNALNRLWIDPPGYFARANHARQVLIAFANYGVSLGLQAVEHWPERVERLNRFSKACALATNITGRQLRTSWPAHPTCLVRSSVHIQFKDERTNIFRRFERRAHPATRDVVALWIEARDPRAP